MKIKDQIEAMARADGCDDRDISIFRTYGIDNGVTTIPDYFTDNEVDRMVRLLDDDEFHQYCKWVGGLCLQWDIHPYKMTAAQKVEAYLKATGLWTKEME